MSPYVLLPIVEATFSFGLLLLLLVYGKRHVAQKPFALFLICMILWGFFIFMMRAAPSLEDAFFWEKLVFVAILSAAMFFFQFASRFTIIKLPKQITYLVYFCYVVLVALIPTGMVVNGMKQMWYGKAPVIGPVFPFFVLSVYLPLALSLIVLLKHRRTSTVLDDRIRDSYVIAGIITMLIGGTTDYLPSLGLNIYPLGIIGNIFFCILATNAMLRHGLLEIKIVLRKGVAYALVSLVIFNIIAILVIVLNIIFQELLNPVSLIITIVTIFATAVAFQPLLSRLQNQVDRWFFRARYDKLQALKNFTADQKDLGDIKQLSRLLVSTIAQGMESQIVYLLLPSHDSGDFFTYAISGEKSSPEPRFAVSSLVVQTLKYWDNLVDINDINIIPILNNISDADRKILENHEVELLVPLKSAQKLVGVLLLGYKINREPYSTEDRLILQNISGEVAVTIENARKYDNVRQDYLKLRRTMEGIVHAMSLSVEARDPYTAGHQKRVADLACAIGREMGFSDWQIEGLRISGLLHDVGKLAVPAEILSKPGRINEHEFSIIKTHPEVGHEILKNIEFPWPITAWILQHHERLDGSGYPSHLSEDEIYLEAKVLAVADVVEAMSSHRPYRPALGIDRALEEISREKGVLYDGKVAEACLRLFKTSKFDFQSPIGTALIRP